MRYSIFIMTIFLLVGCNLGTDTPVPEQNPTQSSVDSVPTADSPIMYWQMLPINEVVPNDTDIVIIDQFILRRVERIASRTDSNIINLELAIQAVIDSDNLWEAENLQIESVLIDSGSASIRLNGTITAVGGAILSAVPTQFYLTAFEDPTIDRVLISLNGENIANLGASHSSQIQANDVAFTREMLATRLGE